MIDNLTMLIIEEQVKQINQLKQTLDRIKDIVEEDFYFLDYDYRWIFEDILQLIRESEKNYED